MNRIPIFVSLLLVVSLPLTIQAAEPSAKSITKPNFVFILVDDMGWRGLSCYGSTYYETPRIDQLASEGMKFTDAYSACHVCSPTRASIMTGQYPARLHLTDFLRGRKEPFSKLKQPRMNMHLPLETTSIAEALKPLGYTTMAIGKWHLGRKKGQQPLDHGFDHAFANAPGKGTMFWPYGSPKVDGVKGQYLTDHLTDEAIKFIDKNRNQPFFLYLSYYAVHNKVEAKVDRIKRYEAKPKGKWQKNATFAAMTDSVDENVGRVLDALKEQKLGDRTVVIFMSDNGPLRSSSCPRPLRDHKGTLFEGGIRVPMIVKWPGLVKPGTTSDEPVSSVDFFPTMVEMAGGKPHDVDGKSLVPLLKQDKSFDRGPIYWHYPHYSNHRMPPGGVIRDGDYKLIELYEDGQLQLYNLKEDLSEKHNLAKKMPEKTKELHTKLKAWRKSVGAQEMTPNPNYDPTKTKWNRRHGKIVNIYDTPPE